MNRLNATIVGLGAVVYVWAAEGAIADSPAVSSDPGSEGLAEIIVTAEKRSSNLMTTGLAMNALAGDTLVDKNVTNLEDLTATTPSFSYTNGGPTSNVNIRGIGLSVVSPNVSPGVPIYRDGILQPTLLSSEPFVDIADVEVLRGPQGTLVGANSTGGAIFINTRNPELGDSNGYAQFEGGSFNREAVQGAYNQPISDSVAIRGAFSWEKRDSFWTDLEPTSAQHAPPGALNQIEARLSVLYQPNDQFSVLDKLNYQDDQNGGMAHTPIAGTNAAVGYPTQHYVLDYADSDSEYSDHQFRNSLRVQYVFDSGVTLRSTTGVFYTYEYYNDEQYVDPTTTTVVSAPFINRIQDHEYSQEFTVLSRPEAQLHWVAGTYSEFANAHINLNPNTMTVVVDEGTVKNSNAAYGEVGFDVTPTLEAHVGLRETFNHAYGNGGVFVIPAGSLEVQSNVVGQTDNEATGRVGVNWKATPDEFVYGFIAKGAKTGGINAQGEPTFSPETVYDYETGLKSTLWDGHVNTQAGVFYMDYNNLQLQVNTPAPAQAPVSTITNLGKSRVKGAEFSVQSKFGGLQIDANVAFVDSSVSAPPLLNVYKYQSAGFSPVGAQCPPGVTVGCFNYTPYYQSASGVANPYSPRWTANLGAQYAFASFNGGTLTPRADFSYTSTQWATIFQNPVDELQQRHVLNFSVTYAKNDWKVAAYGTNVTHDYFITGQTGAQNFWNAPAEYGARISKSF
jgi:iron complex outermembrane receptor protein